MRQNNAGIRPEVTMTFEGRFEAAHFLPHHDGKCQQLHGHNWVVALDLKDRIPSSGMIFDFAKAKASLNRVLEFYDHCVLNDLLNNPTAENLAVDILCRMSILDSNLFYMCTSIQVWESPGCGVILNKEDYIDALEALKREEEQDGGAETEIH